jgi:hypothetical protein
MLLRDRRSGGRVMSYETILFDVTVEIATITINRPDGANTISNQLQADIHSALETGRLMIVFAPRSSVVAELRRQVGPSETRTGGSEPVANTILICRDALEDSVLGTLAVVRAIGRNGSQATVICWSGLPKGGET